MLDSLVIEALEKKETKAKKKGRKLKLKKPRRQIVPMSLEREYLRQLRKIITNIEKEIKRTIIAELPFLVEQSKEKKKPKTDSQERYDINVGRRLKALFIKTRFALRKKNSAESINKKMEKISRQVNRFNKNQVGQVFESVLGVKLLQQEPFLKQQLEEFSIGNANLISNISEDFLNKTQQTVFSGLRKGLRHEEIAKQILGKSKDKQGLASTARKAKSRAALIARDQINKLNGQLTQLRQQNAGVEEYIWRTVKDSRVRDEHRAREGKKFSWNRPPVDGHPGEPINCRCYAEPILSDLI